MPINRERRSRSLLPPDRHRPAFKSDFELGLEKAVFLQAQTRCFLPLEWGLHFSAIVAIHCFL